VQEALSRQVRIDDPVQLVLCFQVRGGVRSEEEENHQQDIITEEEMEVELRRNLSSHEESKPRQKPEHLRGEALFAVPSQLQEETPAQASFVTNQLSCRL